MRAARSSRNAARGCRYLLRFKEGSIPSIHEEYQKLRELEGNRQEETYRMPGKGNGEKGWKEKTVWHDYVTGIAYEGMP